MKNHFDLALNLYKSKIKYNIEADLIFIFSNEEQKDKFALKIKDELGINDMFYNIMPNEFSIYKAKAVTKKLYGLKEFMNKYDYIILTDCESEFIRHFNAEKVAEKIWNSHSMLASNLSPDGFFIMRKCYKQMGLYYNKNLRKALGGFKYNFWFNELQVYKCSYLPGFFDWLSNFDIEKIYNTWDCFEYYVFYAYLCLVHGMQIKKYRYICMGGINERLYLFSVKKQKKILRDMQFHWAASRDVKSEEIYMLFHLDRIQNYYRRLDGSDNGIYILLKKINRFKHEIILYIKRYFVLLMEFPEYLSEIKKQ